MTHLAAILMVANALWAAAEPVAPIDLSKGWEQRCQGPWRTRYDHRDLLVMYHPWIESEKGDFAWVSRDVTVPDTWTGATYLSFYCADDYNTDTWRPDGSWLTAEGFIGHRVKQVLVDQRVVWSADVSDAAPQGTPPPQRVELPVKPGQKFLLTLLAFDTVASKTILPEDFYQSANNAKKREDDPDAARFMTHVYWGDLALVTGDATPKPGKRPAEKAVRSVHTKRWPLPPFGDPWTGPISLELSSPAGIPKQGFPLRCGLPLHAGKAKSPADIGLKIPGQRPVATQKTPLGIWPDESLRWVLFQCPIQPNAPKFELTLAKDPATFTSKARIMAPETTNTGIAGSIVTVDADGVAFAAKQGGALTDVKYRGAAKIASLAFSLTIDGEEFPGTAETLSVAEEGPFCYTVNLDGRFESLERSVGLFHATCSAYANLPYLTVSVRIINNGQNPLPVSALKVSAQLAEAPAGLRGPSGEVKDGLVLRQTAENARELNGTAVDPLPPAFAAWKGGCLTVRRFRELFPKSLAVNGKELVADLVAAADKPVVFTPGEAKTHELWFAFGDVDPVQFAATVSTPPILQNPAYFCATGAIGPAATHEGDPVLREYMTASFGQKRWEDFGQSFGVRDFPDSAYFGGIPKWSNNYYERSLGLYSEWFMGGGRVWSELAGDVCRHLLDVAVIHAEIPGKQWMGAMHGPGENHVSGPWNPNLRTAGLALHWALTGDPAAREAVLSVGDYCVRTHAGTDSPSVRDHAGPFDSICTAFQETGDVKYLDEGALRVKSTLDRMDTRRGVWAETHGSQVYRGNVPWMVAQLGRPLYLWYRASGDIQAAQALVGLAESIICENTDWDHPGEVSGYSHNPHFQASSNYDLMILPVIFAAYELTEDPFFLDAAKAQWQRLQNAKTFDSPLNCYWNTPWLMHELRANGLAKAPGPAAKAGAKAQARP